MEEMSAFFAARVEGYDAHMLQDVEGCREGYAALAAALPQGARDVLDLGCGTGLELDALFARQPDLRVTGIDLTQAMLDALRAKHPVRALRLLCADYFAVDFGRAAFDAAVSFESLHHFPAERKRALYRRVCEALRPGGVFLLGDYMVETEAEAEDLARRAAQLRAEAGTPDAAIVHLDTPLTVETEKALLLQAGFSKVACLLRKGNTTLLRAQRA